MRKKLLAAVLVAAMLMTAFPMTALAADAVEPSMPPEVETSTDSAEAPVETPAAPAEMNEDAFLAALETGSVTLTNDVTLTKRLVMNGGSAEVNLNGHKLITTYVTSKKDDPCASIELFDKASLTIKNGEIVANQYQNAAQSVMAANTGCRLFLEKVDYVTTGSALFPAGDAATVQVNNSTIRANGYCVATNAGTTDNYNVVIDLKNSYFYGSPDGAGTAMYINVPGTLTMDNCKVQGYLHGLFVRGGTADIRNSTITNTPTFVSPEKAEWYQNVFVGDDKNWKDGNAVTLAALTMGNKGGGRYANYATNVTLTNTQVISNGTYGSMFPAVYSWVDEGSANTVTFTSDANCSFDGDLKFDGKGGNPVNTTVNLKGGAFTDLEDGIRYAVNGSTVRLLKDVSGNGVVIDTAEKSLTIDLGGHTYTVDGTTVGSAGTETNGFQLLKGGAVTIQNGTLATSQAKILIQNYCNLTLENVTVDARGSAVCQYAISNNCGSSKLIGSTSVLAADGWYAFDVCYWPAYYPEGVSVLVDTTGAIRGNIEYSNYGNEADVAEKAVLTIQNGTFEGEIKTLGLNNTKANIQISGGVFTQDPSDYLTQCKSAPQNGSGLYVVTDNHTWDQGVVTVEPTFSTTGVRTYTCTVCHATREESIPALQLPMPPVVNPGAGSSTQTTTKPDGSTVTTTVDKTTGTVTETVKTPEGVTGTTVTDAAGTVTSVNAQIPAAVAKDAAESGETVTLPVTVPVSSSTAAAPAVGVDLPENVANVKVEIPTQTVTPGTVAVIVRADGSEEIVKTSVPTASGVALTLDGDAVVKIVDNTKVFQDVQGKNHWAADVVEFVTAREIFNGTAQGVFSPEEPMTRAMLMTVLARFDGVNTDGGEKWYDKGLAWAVSAGISDGSQPSGVITREQLATMLYRYVGSPAVGASELGKLSAFPDSGSVGSFAQEAMAWAVSAGLIGGMEGSLAPEAAATRAQVAAILARFCQM